MPAPSSSSPIQRAGSPNTPSRKSPSPSGTGTGYGRHRGPKSSPQHQACPSTPSWPETAKNRPDQALPNRPPSHWERTGNRAAPSIQNRRTKGDVIGKTPPFHIRQRPKPAVRTQRITQAQDSSNRLNNQTRAREASMIVFTRRPGKRFGKPHIWFTKFCGACGEPLTAWPDSIPLPKAAEQRRAEERKLITRL